MLLGNNIWIATIPLSPLSNQALVIRIQLRFRSSSSSSSSSNNNNNNDNILIILSSYGAWNK